MTITRSQLITRLRRFHVETDDILRHGSFDGTIGVKGWYDLAEVKKWLVWSGVEIVEYRD